MSTLTAEELTAVIASVVKNDDIEIEQKRAAVLRLLTVNTGAVKTVEKRTTAPVEPRRKRSPIRLPNGIVINPDDVQEMIVQVGRTPISGPAAVVIKKRFLNLLALPSVAIAATSPADSPSRFGFVLIAALLALYAKPLDEMQTAFFRALDRLPLGPQPVAQWAALMQQQLPAGAVLTPQDVLSVAKSLHQTGCSVEIDSNAQTIECTELVLDVSFVDPW